jgi:hypothetical protein
VDRIEVLERGEAFWLASRRERTRGTAVDPGVR